MAELAHTHEREKSRMLTSYQADKDAWDVEREAELDRLRQSMHEELGQQEARANERQERDAQVSDALHVWSRCHSSPLNIKRR